MNDSSVPSVSDSSDALSFLEKLVEVRLLVLALALVFYLDIWALRANFDPTTITLDQLSKHLQDVPVFQVAAFFLSFSILAGAFFPALRLLIGLLRVHFTDAGKFLRAARPAAEKRLSDWALALVSLSLYDLCVGLFSTGPYKGFGWYLVHIFESNALEPALFRVTAFFFLLACLFLAIEIDT